MQDIQYTFLSTKWRCMYQTKSLLLVALKNIAVANSYSRCQIKSWGWGLERKEELIRGFAIHSSFEWSCQNFAPRKPLKPFYRMALYSLGPSFALFFSLSQLRKEQCERESTLLPPLFTFSYHFAWFFHSISDFLLCVCLYACMHGAP